MKDTLPHRRVVSIATAANNGAVETSVRDHGCGIAPETLPHIFDAFVTTHSAGLGMGLAICRRLIEAHGGRIEARNNLDGGATFLFSLPLTREMDQHERA
jgi:signal transduction histidine kinase